MSVQKSSMVRGGGHGSPSLLSWVAVAAILTAAAYVGGAAMARQWSLLPAQLSSVPTPTPQPQPPTPSPAHQLAAAAPADSELGAEGQDEWTFQAHAGQTATLEVWFHPGSGSNIDAELTVLVLAPDGTLVANQTGSVFLPPYLVIPQLPADGAYRVHVAAASGAPGRYSLALDLDQGEAMVSSGNSAGPTPTVSASQVAAVAQAKFLWPTPRREISGWTFHDPGNPSHIGLDIATAMWDKITAAAGGTVVFSAWGGGYGNLVIVQHGEDWLTYYAHLEEIAVEKGDVVKQGQVLGGAGTTGYSTGPHLHFEIRYKGRPVDPHVYLP